MSFLLENNIVGEDYLLLFFECEEIVLIYLGNGFVVLYLIEVNV